MYKSRTFRKIYSFTSPVLIFFVAFLSLGGILIFPRSTLAANINSCQSIYGENTYDIQNDISTGGDCFVIYGSGAIINGHGYTVNGNIVIYQGLDSGSDGFSIQISDLTLNGDIVTSGFAGVAGSGDSGGNGGDVSISNTIVNGDIVAVGGNGGDGSAGGAGGVGGNGATVTLSNNSSVTGSVNVYGGNGGVGGVGTDGTPGGDNNGVNGIDGAPGEDCIEGTNCSGGDGHPGENGMSGGVGGDGGTGGSGGVGGDGGNGGIINIDATSYVLNRDVASGFGGAGGAGGNGGLGGSAFGGLGGTGGRGGYHSCDTSDPENPQCGVDGQPGANGFDGSDGTAGSQGPSGDSGAMGSNGSAGTIYDNSIADVYGCTDSSASNYDSSATNDDGSCAYDVHGCTDSSACNYDSSATIDSGCDYTCMSTCDDESACNYGSTGSCDYSCNEIPGCTDPSASNYNPSATNDDGSCTYITYGCTDSSACNYNSSATDDDGSCEYSSCNVVYGCTDSNATNYNPSATSDDGSCTYEVSGCMNPAANNYNPSATSDDGSCTFDVLGCTDIDALNYDSSANIGDSSCYYVAINSPTDSDDVTVWSPSVNWGIYGAQSCMYSYNSLDWFSVYCHGSGTDISPPSIGDVTLYIRSTSAKFGGEFIPETSANVSFNYGVLGCTDSDATNYNSSATIDDGSCIIYGCTDPGANNYDPSATNDNASCSYNISGCTDPLYQEYDSSATVDDGSCLNLINNGANTLVVSTVSVSPGSTTAVIGWSTNINASSQVTYGPLGYTNNSALISDNTQSHSVTLTGLVPCSSYNYKVVSVGGLSQIAESNDDYFVTTGCTGNSTVLSSISDSVAVSSGGTVANEDLSIYIPEDFTSATTSATFQIKKINKTDFIQTVPSPSGKNFIGAVYNLKALVDDNEIISAFERPIRVTLTYQSSDIININTSSLAIYRYDGSDWYPLSNCSVDTGARTVSCDTSNFSDFAIFGTTYTPIISGGGGGSVFNYISTITNQNKKLATTTIATTTPIKESLVELTPHSQDLNFVFTKTQKLGDVGTEVRSLQRYLNALGYTVAKTGPGSKGKETMTFGPATKAALIKYQKHYNIKPASGYFGPITKSFTNALLVKANSKK